MSDYRLISDSAVLSLSREELRNTVENKMLASYDAKISSVIHDPSLNRPSHGLFKHEFTDDENIITGGVFHSTKCYALRVESRKRKRSATEDDDDDDDVFVNVKRFKGTARSIQNTLELKHFDLDPQTGLSRPAFANRSKLAATIGFQMTLTPESKRLVNPINVKRRFDVRNMQR